MSTSRAWEDHRGAVLDSVQGFDVLECETCRFKHIVPLPSPIDVRDMYCRQYYAKEKPLYLERHREDLEWWNLAYSRRYDFFETHLPPERRRVLDVGCGPGFFLLHGKERGWKTLGIEPSVQASAHSRGLGLEVIGGLLDEPLLGRLDRFDVVHLEDVLEHIPDPEAMLRRVYRLLDPGGLVCVIVPNDYNALQQLLRQRMGFDPWWIAPPHHINYFCRESLERLLARVGFHVLHQTTTFPMELFLLMGENYVGNDSVGRRIHGMRKALEVRLAQAHASDILDDLYLHLARRGLGRECIVIASQEQADIPAGPAQRTGVNGGRHRTG